MWKEELGPHARSMEQREEKGETSEHIYIYTDLHGRFRDLYRIRAAAASGPSQHTRMVLLLPPVLAVSAALP